MGNRFRIEELDRLQEELHKWREGNFEPKTLTPLHQIIGMGEELGELCHHMLKQEQGIRGDWIEHEREGMDAVGDLMIFCMGLCSLKGWNFGVILKTTAEEVLGRDWKSDPKKGIKAEIGKGEDI